MKTLTITELRRAFSDALKLLEADKAIAITKDGVVVAHLTRPADTEDVTKSGVELPSSEVAELEVVSVDSTTRSVAVKRIRGMISPGQRFSVKDPQNKAEATILLTINMLTDSDGTSVKLYNGDEEFRVFVRPFRLVIGALTVGRRFLLDSVVDNG